MTFLAKILDLGGDPPAYRLCEGTVRKNVLLAVLDQFGISNPIEVNGDNKYVVGFADYGSEGRYHMAVWDDVVWNPDLPGIEAIDLTTGRPRLLLAADKADRNPAWDERRKSQVYSAHLWREFTKRLDYDAAEYAAQVGTERR